MNTHKSISEVIIDTTLSDVEPADLKSIHEIDKNVVHSFGDLVICNADGSHIREIAELWANHASIQQLNAPERYNFKMENSDWREFVKNKLNKKNNLLLVAHDKGAAEVKGFLYLQTVTIPSSEFILKGIIEDIYTKPQHRKQGIATNLLNVAIEWSAMHNIRQTDLISVANAKDLLAFYNQYLKLYKSKINIGLVSI